MYFLGPAVIKAKNPETVFVCSIVCVSYLLFRSVCSVGDSFKPFIIINYGNFSFLFFREVNPAVAKALI